MTAESYVPKSKRGKKPEKFELIEEDRVRLLDEAEKMIKYLDKVSSHLADAVEEVSNAMWAVKDKKLEARYMVLWDAKDRIVEEKGKIESLYKQWVEQAEKLRAN